VHRHNSRGSATWPARAVVVVGLLTKPAGTVQQGGAIPGRWALFLCSCGGAPAWRAASLQTSRGHVPGWVLPGPHVLAPLAWSVHQLPLHLQYPVVDWLLLWAVAAQCSLQVALGSLHLQDGHQTRHLPQVLVGVPQLLVPGHRGTGRLACQQRPRCCCMNAQWHPHASVLPFERCSSGVVPWLFVGVVVFVVGVAWVLQLPGQCCQYPCRESPATTPAARWPAAVAAAVVAVSKPCGGSEAPAAHTHTALVMVCPWCGPVS
jgi:hypothetical protein